ncbi:hypothetical protein ACIBG8_13530 [Nonomuraea sp. NPDC050556]|uniref:hypothetical protein n=1 Tax=Nonomuraea sp. NPDC050556 TaxID=3364369 RepID=UPI0037B90661
MVEFLFVAALALVVAWPVFGLAVPVFVGAAVVGALRGEWRGRRVTRQPSFWRRLAGGAFCGGWAIAAYGLTQSSFLQIDPDAKCPVYDGDTVFKRVPWDDPECVPVPVLVWVVAVVLAVACVACLVMAVKARRPDRGSDRGVSRVREV